MRLKKPQDSGLGRANEGGGEGGGENLAETTSLSVHFNWNGHSWDAFEVLGLLPGTDLDAVRRAYQQASTCCDADSVAFLTAAFEAITQS